MRPHEQEKRCESEQKKASRAGRKKDGKTLYLGLMKNRRYIDSFCSAKSFLCPSLQLLLVPLCLSPLLYLTLSISVVN